ncbi:hypothetical protein B0H13DRAFT_2265946 [Mycena leptocephala]|nr:hypothetical protein B0H13DRAFT_2265946 [Mycena leptocephala]
MTSTAFHNSVVFPLHLEDPGMSLVLSPGTPDLRLARPSSQYECVPFSPQRGPGSTLHRFYSAGGQFLEENANRMAYKLGMGPHAVCQRIQAFFGDGPEREAKLDELKHGEIPLVKKWCLRLMKYVLPTTSAELLPLILSSGASPFSSLISVRYLGGILELPSFWSQTGTMFESVVQKILLRTTVILRDLGVDSREEIETLSFDTEAIDILCAAVLAGIEGWLVGRQADDVSAEYWYQEFRQAAQEEILPYSWTRATTGLLKAMIPNVYRAEVIRSLVLEFRRVVRMKAYLCSAFAVGQNGVAPSFVQSVVLQQVSMNFINTTTELYFT